MTAQLLAACTIATIVLGVFPFAVINAARSALESLRMAIAG